MGVDVAYRCVCQRIHAIAGQLDKLVFIVIKDGVVGFGSEFEEFGAEPIFIAAAHAFGNRLLAGEVPLANVACLILRLTEEMVGQSFHV